MIGVYTILWFAGVQAVCVAAWEDRWILVYVIGRLAMYIANEMANAWMNKNKGPWNED